MKHARTTCTLAVVAAAATVTAAGCARDPALGRVGQASRIGENGLNLGGNGLNLGVNGINLGNNGFNLGVNGLNLGVNGLNLGNNGLNLGVNGFHVGHRFNTDVDGWEDFAQLVTYLVRCAAPSGVMLTTPDGDSFAGMYGLATSWEHGPFSEEDERWVSACLMALTNATGTHVPVSVRGSHSQLSQYDPADSDFPIAEAVFFGNLFDDGVEVYVAPVNPLVIGNNPELAGYFGYLQTRLCGTSPVCGFTQVAPLGIDYQGYAPWACDGVAGPHLSSRYL